MTDQKAAVYPFDISTLISDGRFADRFSYSSYFIPLQVAFKDDPTTPVLTFPQREWVAQLASKLPEEVMNRWLDDLGLSRLAARNRVENRREVVSAPAAGGAVATPGTSTVATPDDTFDATIGEIRLYAKIIASAPAAGGQVANLLTAALTKLERQSSSAAATAAPGGQQQNTPPHETPGQEIRESLPDEGKNLLLTLVQSEIGYLFLDRTRIRPKGLAIGEHLYSLSLAPSEEVTLEQKAYSKRTQTMEEANEREQSMDLELASTLTSELNESMDRTRSLTDNWGLNLSHTGAYKSPEFFWGSFNASHTIGYTRNVTEANTETARRSIKDSQSTSSKISAKYRSLHKVTFSLKTETGFESTSKRVIRNQNRFTPVDYHFFKFLRVTELSQERYGAMLCWAPFVKSPAKQFFARLQNGKNEILARAEAQIATEPQPPQSDAPPDKFKYVWSSQVEADRWDILGNMFQNYTLSIPIPRGWEWVETDASGKTLPYPYGIVLEQAVTFVAKSEINLVGFPSIEAGQLKLTVSVAVPPTTERGDTGKTSRIYLRAKAQFILVDVPDPVTVEAQTAAFEDYVTRHKAWVDDAAKTRADAAEAADAWEAAMLANSSPVNELVNRLITEHFSPDVRNEGSEIELWQRIFQWDAASYVLYPGYWTDDSLRDPLGEPNSFFNASWARLFLPVRPGMEAMAMRWIFSKTTQMTLESGLNDTITEVVSDLEKYREAHFAQTVTPSTTPGGCPDAKENYVCLGHWEETLPTDGTHIEVTQSASLSIDQVAQRDLDDTAKLRDAVLDSRKQDAELKRKAAVNLTGAPTVEIKIHTDAATVDPGTGSSNP